MRVERLPDSVDAARYLGALGVESGGVGILSAKMRHYLFHIADLHVGAANILKQDALSVGADLAVPKGTVTAQTPRVDAILIATRRQLLELIRKEKAQPLGLKAVAEALERHAKGHRPGPTKIMGIVNANDDSFFSGSRFTGDAAVAAIERLMEEGAEYIDVGAVSSRPGSAPVSEAEELDRIRPIADAIYERGLYDKARFSADTYMPKVAAYVAERGFSLINDITGLANDELCRVCAANGAAAVVMHMQGEPQTMQAAPAYEDLLGEVTAFFEARLEKAERFGIDKVILDVGIGFGKSLEHNLELIAKMEHFLQLGRPLLIGASRKSMIGQITPTPTEARLPGTLAIHLKAVENGAEIVRCHDVAAHFQALRVSEAIAGV